MSGYIAWPEGQPERARFARTWLGKLWLMVGPMGWRTMLNGRRMINYWPALPRENHKQTARNLEELFARHHKHCGAKP